MSVLHPSPPLGDKGGGQGRTGEDRGGIFRHSHSIEAIPSESKYTGIPREFLLKQSLSECGVEYLSVLLQLYLLYTTPYPPLYNPFLFLPLLLLLLLPSLTLNFFSSPSSSLTFYPFPPPQSVTSINLFSPFSFSFFFSHSSSWTFYSFPRQPPSPTPFHPSSPLDLPSIHPLGLAGVAVSSELPLPLWRLAIDLQWWWC